MSPRPIHVDEQHLQRAIAALEAQQAVHQHDPGGDGVAARIHLAALRPFYEAMAREISAGASRADMWLAVVTFAANLLVSIAETNTDRDPLACKVEISRALVELGCTVAAFMRDDDPEGRQSVGCIEGGNA